MQNAYHSYQGCRYTMSCDVNMVSPSRQDLLKVNVGSISFLILMSASNTIGPQLFRSTLYSCIRGLSPGLSGSWSCDKRKRSCDVTRLFVEEMCISTDPSVDEESFQSLCSLWLSGCCLAASGYLYRLHEQSNKF